MIGWENNVGEIFAVEFLSWFTPLELVINQQVFAFRAGDFLSEVSQGELRPEVQTLIPFNIRIPKTNIAPYSYL